MNPDYGRHEKFTRFANVVKRRDLNAGALEDWRHGDGLAVFFDTQEILNEAIKLLKDMIGES